METSIINAYKGRNAIYLSESSSLLLNFAPSMMQSRNDASTVTCNCHQIPHCHVLMPSWSHAFYASTWTWMLSTLIWTGFFIWRLIICWWPGNCNRCSYGWLDCLCCWLTMRIYLMYWQKCRGGAFAHLGTVTWNWHSSCRMISKRQHWCNLSAHAMTLMHKICTLYLLKLLMTEHRNR
jgi:hypothetical protein